MKPAALGVLLLLLGSPSFPAGLPDEPFRPKGAHNNSVHRFHPDLEARLNAVRYGRWRALEIAWASGIDASRDRDFSAYLVTIIAAAPRFPPEADRVAPTFAREAASVFHALRWGQTLEQQFLDALASADANPSVSRERVERAVRFYRRDPYALSEPDRPANPAALLDRAPASSRILINGTRLFAAASADFLPGDFAGERWRVKKSVDEFDHSYRAERMPSEASYRVAAPAVREEYPVITDLLDRVARFRTEVFAALIPGGATAEARSVRDERLRTVARRYGLPAGGIGGR